MGQRIDGWKAIGSHFGRDRTTVMRWADSRGLPVHRVPGGQRASVYAFREELDAWLQQQTGDLDEAAPPAPTPASPSRQRRVLFWIVLAAGLAFAVAMGIGLARRPAPPPKGKLEMPADPEVARLYLQARDDWAQRTSPSIDRAIATLTEVTRRDPGFAPAHASLAEAWLLAREFGSQSDSAAFPRALDPAERALKIDGALHAAHRAKGFILYWWLHEPEAAGAAFRRALELAPRDAQTHFWYGNALSDNGAHEAALRELDTARLIEPGSVAIQTDFAWAQWAAGKRDEAVEMLERLRQSNPGFAVVHECLAHIRLADGDYPGFVEGFARMAALRGNGEMTAQAAAFRTALAQDIPALQRALTDAAGQDMARDPRQDHIWIAFLASTARDRDQLVDLLRRARDRKERWGGAGFVSRIASRWSADVEISALLRALRQPLMA